ncbi:ribbon-helix-helix protein, CopG family [Vallitalea guaymasensis]|uniref:Ribbon-helix-helix protein, CopG family n=1 Tax=Vallitalea guaymasensis TaxID=1185412 RepID=A0A8J8M9Z3_9FIRM|nr:ribbon-helix-helix protein, CopG family [Vallitalea guaymasensis]QUH28845.1 ribbon-helix-helix protein, CopG family [Vallitalea guaymasensis]
MASKKMGRPLSDNPKNIRLQLRVDKETMDMLDECAKELNSNRSDVVRKGIKKVADDLKAK